MSKVQGVKEKLHSPMYDAFFVPQGTPFQTEMQKRDPRVIRYFMDVQNKTKLETNLPAAGVLPSLNTFEARALRVVVSSLHRFGPTSTEPKKELKAERNEAEILADLIYNSVTTLIVGEKVMIEMPTFWFPAGAGVSPGLSTVPGHGEPNPTATFRFAEPVFIEPQQNFRVEILFPQGLPGQATDEHKLAGVKGPLRIWVVLDGYLTRDVQ
ncbi:MAG TPA: hypothetical protein VH681_00195 [Nitrospiraceae bacterium]|jgi:hypothetical protein